MSFELRPLAMGELLDRSFSLYRRHPVLFIGIMAVPSVFALAIGLFLTALTTGQALFQLDPTADGPPSLPSASLILALIGGYIAFVLVYGIAYMMALGASAFSVSELYLGRVSTIRGAFARMRHQVGRLLLLAILLLLRVGGLAVGLLFLFGIVVGVVTVAVPLLGVLIMIVGFMVTFALIFYLGLRYTLAVPILVLEESKANAAIKRSVLLTKGYLGRTFLLLLCAMVLSYAALAIFQMLFTISANLAGLTTRTGFWLSMAGVVSGTIGATLTSPVLIIGLAVLYYDLRIRKEALDVQMMMMSLDAGDGAAAIAPAAASLPPDPAV